MTAKTKSSPHRRTNLRSRCTLDLQPAALQPVAIVTVHGRGAALAAMVGEVLGHEFDVGAVGRLAGPVHAVDPGAQAAGAQDVGQARNRPPVAELGVVGDSVDRVGEDLGARRAATAFPAAAPAGAIDARRVAAEEGGGGGEGGEEGCCGEMVDGGCELHICDVRGRALVGVSLGKLEGGDEYQDCCRISLRRIPTQVDDCCFPKSQMQGWFLSKVDKEGGGI